MGNNNKKNGFKSVRFLENPDNRVIARKILRKRRLRFRR